MNFISLPELSSGQKASWIGALVIKSAAFSNPLDRARDRHLEDIALLSTLLTAVDAPGNLSKN